MDSLERCRNARVGEISTCSVHSLVAPGYRRLASMAAGISSRRRGKHFGSRPRGSSCASPRSCGRGRLAAASRQRHCIRAMESISPAANLRRPAHLGTGPVSLRSRPCFAFARFACLRLARGSALQVRIVRKAGTPRVSTRCASPEMSPTCATSLPPPLRWDGMSPLAGMFPGPCARTSSGRVGLYPWQAPPVGFINWGAGPGVAVLRAPFLNLPDRRHQRYYGMDARRPPYHSRVRAGFRGALERHARPPRSRGRLAVRAFGGPSRRCRISTVGSIPHGARAFSAACCRFLTHAPRRAPRPENLRASGRLTLDQFTLAPLVRPPICRVI